MKYVYIFIVLMFGEYVFAQSGVIAHRGFWKTDGSAQNSIAALLKADSVGCYGSEFDICLTKDNKWVVAHGPAVGGHKIAESTLEELTVLKLENGENVPSLEQFLKVAKRRLV